MGKRRCLLDELIVDVLSPHMVLVKPEFVEIFRVERYGYHEGLYVVDVYELPKPLTQYILTYYVEPVLGKMGAARRQGQQRRRRWRPGRRGVVSGSELVVARAENS